MNVGGPAFLIRGLMNGMNRDNYEQLLVTGHCNSNENEISEVDNLGQVIRISSLQREIEVKNDLFSVLNLNKITKAFEPQIIHTHTFKAGLLIRFSFFFKRKKEIILIHHYHGHLIEGYFGGFKKFIYLGIERVLAIRTNLILTDGDKVARDLIDAGIGSLNKFKTITPGVEEPNHDQKTRKNFQKDLIIGFVGRFTQIKRPDKFISVVEKIYKTHPHVKFVMFGDGELRKQIQNEIDAKKLPVDLYDFASSAYEVLAQIDLLLVTSDNEGTPLTVMEASYVGVPCIAVNVGAISEIVIDGVNGKIVKNSVDDLVAATLKVINDRIFFEALSDSSIDYARENFSMSGYVEKIELVYSELLSSGLVK